MTLDAGVTLSSTTGNLASATVVIQSGVTAGDMLNLNLPASAPDLTVSDDAVTGVLTLAAAGGSAPIAEFQAALQAIT